MANHHLTNSNHIASAVPNSSKTQKALVLYCHPFPYKSINNDLIKAAITDLPDVTIHDLYERYPDFHIDADLEQAAIQNHQIIVFQFPMYWFSCPALLKEWVDEVLEEGFAYGRGGSALHGKDLRMVVTVGEREEAYQPRGLIRYTTEDLFAPWEALAGQCGMRWLPPLILFGTRRIEDEQRQVFIERYKQWLIEATQTEGLYG